MEINNLGNADGLTPADWAAVVEKESLTKGCAPVPEQPERGLAGRPA